MNPVLSPSFTFYWKINQMPFAQGTYGKVYLATSTSNPNEHAILKVFKASKTDQRDSEHEWAILRRIEELKVTRVIKLMNPDLLTYRRKPALLLKDGGYPLNHPPYKGLLPAQKVLRIARDVLQAQHGLSKAGLIHTDLTENNIVVKEMNSDFPHARVIDVGCALNYPASPLLLLGEDYTALSHRAPEAILKVPFSPNYDQWAIGITLLNTYLGHNPFYQSKSADDLEGWISSLSLIVGQLGMPSKHFLDQSSLWSLYFAKDEYQNYTPLFPITQPSEHFVTAILKKGLEKGDNANDTFMLANLISTLLRYPEDRLSTADILCSFLFDGLPNKVFCFDIELTSPPYGFSKEAFFQLYFLDIKIPTQLASDFPFVSFDLEKVEGKPFILPRSATGFYFVRLRSKIEQLPTSCYIETRIHKGTYTLSSFAFFPM